MAIASHQTIKLIDTILKTLFQRNKKLNLLVLGFPDLVIPISELESILGKERIKETAIVDDADPVWRWHNKKTYEGQPMLDPLSLFNTYGECTIDVIDIYASRGMELIVDLNQPFPNRMLNNYDFIFDPGTFEHCFNIGQAFKNVAQAARVGGFIYTGGPLNMYNHGFYSLNPTLYIDFFGQNGFKIHDIFGSTTLNDDTFRINTTDRFLKAPANSGISAIIEKIEHKEIIWPTQTKYLKNKELKS